MVIPNYCKWVLPLVSFVISSVVVAQSSIEIDSLVARRMRERNIPGLAYAVVKNGQVIHKAVFGFSDVSFQRPVTAGTVFEIASMTKQFTCAAVLLLEEEKKLSLNDRLSKYIADIPAAWNNITLFQLMNHTSGLGDDWDQPTSYFYDNHTTEKMRQAQQSKKLFFLPGESFCYSSGPFFLGLVIEKITGKHYSKFLQERIFGPLNMHCTYVYNDSIIIPERASGYWWKNGKLQNGVDLPPEAEGRADVGILSCIDDMIKWCIALKDTTLLSKQSITRFFSSGALNNGQPVPYSMGWYLYPFRTKILYEHGGAFRTGFNSRIMLFPEDNIGVVVLCNLWRADLADLSYELAGNFIPAFKKAVTQEGIKDDSPRLTHAFEQLLRKLANPELNRELLYKQVNVAGYDHTEIASLLKGFTSLTLINKRELHSPLVLYGKEIRKILYYDVEANVRQTWAFYLTGENELVVVNTE